MKSCGRCCKQVCGEQVQGSLARETSSGRGWITFRRSGGNFCGRLLVHRAEGGGGAEKGKAYRRIELARASDAAICGICPEEVP